MTRLPALLLPLVLALPATAQTASRISVITGPMPSAEGAPVTLTALVSARDGVPAGTVTFRDGATVLGTATLVATDNEVIAAGHRHTCVITGAGGVMCWGFNINGQLGDGTPINGSLPPVAVQGLPEPVVRLTSGASHTCALTESGGVWCWGFNSLGQLGNGVQVSAQPTPVQPTGLSSGVRDLAAGGNHTCAVTTAGAALCWGNNEFGQIGDGTTSNRSAPTAVSGLGSGVASIFAGLSHSCALLTNGTAQCWGFNSFGQLGDGTTTQRTTPVAVGFGGTITSLAGGQFHTCLTDDLGRVYCFGQGDFGQMGDGGTLNINTAPVYATRTFRYTALGRYGNDHTCGIGSEGAVRCWGLSFFGQVGDGSVSTRTTPVLTNPRQSAWAVATGTQHSCAVQRSGAVMCWGYNLNRELGDGTTTQRNNPTPVVGGDFALPMADAVARIVVSDLPPGRRALTATFEGSVDHDPSTSRVRRHLVQ